MYLLVICAAIQTRFLLTRYTAFSPLLQATMLLYQHGDFQEVPGARSVIWHIRANLTTKREDDAGKVLSTRNLAPVITRAHERHLGCESSCLLGLLAPKLVVFE
jgi:hypothetical protein